jgi:glycosyltransferase involved in cell wall biosynthesis
MEAMACGTPVVAFRRGALSEVVQNNETGFLVDSVDEMAEALAKWKKISPRVCRAYAEQHFSATRMATEYDSLYADLLEKLATNAA